MHVHDVGEHPWSGLVLRVRSQLQDGPQQRHLAFLLNIDPCPTTQNDFQLQGNLSIILNLVSEIQEKGSF